MPVATIFTGPAPPSKALIPVSAPDTETAVMEMPAPLASLAALMPSPPAPVTVPLTSISISPPPALLATIALKAPLISLPPADWVNLMPPIPPACVRVNAVFPVPARICLPDPTSTAVSELSVTFSRVTPLAPRDWETPI